VVGAAAAAVVVIATLDIPVASAIGAEDDAEEAVALVAPLPHWATTSFPASIVFWSFPKAFLAALLVAAPLL
jgi:hypothetical protein